MNQGDKTAEEPDELEGSWDASRRRLTAEDWKRIGERTQRLEDESDARAAEEIRQYNVLKARAKKLRRWSLWPRPWRRSYAQIADILGISEDAARSMVKH